MVYPKSNSNIVRLITYSYKWVVGYIGQYPVKLILNIITHE